MWEATRTMGSNIRPFPVFMSLSSRGCGDLKNVQPIIAKASKTNDRRWSRVAATRDLPTIAFFRAGGLLRRSVPVPGILATHPPGAIMDKSGRQFVARDQFQDDRIKT